VLPDESGGQLSLDLGQHGLLGLSAFTAVGRIALVCLSVMGRLQGVHDRTEPVGSLSIENTQHSKNYRNRALSQSWPGVRAGNPNAKAYAIRINR
jgi:hypothetical protein